MENSIKKEDQNIFSNLISDTKNCKSNENENENENENNKNLDEEELSECESIETDCSISSNDEDNIEFDSDISSDDSLFFYSESDEFIDNEYLRINHKPFLKLLKSKSDEDNMSISKMISKSLFEKIDELNKELETEYNKLKDELNKDD